MSVFSLHFFWCSHNGFYRSDFYTYQQAEAAVVSEKMKETLME